MVFHVVQVVLQLLGGVFHRGAVLVPHLSPTRHARLDAVAHSVELDLLGQLVDEEAAFGARANEAHVALEHREQLRQLVHPQLANDFAHACHAAVAGGGPAGYAVLFGVGPHAAELDHVEWPVAQADAFLPVQHRAGALELDGQGGHRHDGQRDEDQHRGAEDVEHPLDGGAHDALVEAVAEDQPARRHGVQADLAEVLFVEGGDVGDAHAAQLAIEQRAHGHAAAAALGDGHHDFIDALVLHQVGQGQVGGHHLARRHLLFLLVGAGQVTAELGVGARHLQGAPHGQRARARAEHQHPALGNGLGQVLAHQHLVEQQHGRDHHDQHHRPGAAVERFQRHQQQHGDNERRGHAERHQRARQRLPGRQDGAAVVEAEGGVDGQEAESHQQAAGRAARDLRRGKVFGLGQRDQRAHEHAGHQRHVEQELYECVSVEVVVEESDHARFSGRGQVGVLRVPPSASCPFIRG